MADFADSVYEIERGATHCILETMGRFCLACPDHAYSERCLGNTSQEDAVLAALVAALPGAWIRMPRAAAPGPEAGQLPPATIPLPGRHHRKEAGPWGGKRQAEMRSAEARVDRLERRARHPDHSSPAPGE